MQTFGGSTYKWRNKAMEQSTKMTLKALKKRGFKEWFANSADEAREVITGIIFPEAVVGIGDSSTVRQIGVIEALQARGNLVINPFNPTAEIKDLQTHFDYSFWPMIEATVSDIFLTGTNALTEDGIIVNVDGVGNRVSGMFWGHPVSIVVVGKNKLARNLEEALKRIKNVVAPEHIRRKGGSPVCTKTGRCHDCSGEKRICAITTLIERKPLFTEINVVVVDEDLGLSWDRSWDQKRINSIVNRHEKFMCPLPPGTGPSTKDDLLSMARMKKPRVVSTCNHE
jgi:hypothetical protein